MKTLNELYEYQAPLFQADIEAWLWETILEKKKRLKAPTKWRFTLLEVPEVGESYLLGQIELCRELLGLSDDDFGKEYDSLVVTEE